MKYTRKQLWEMQEYVKDKLISLGNNHTYPTEERILARILCVLMEVKVE